jgi:hypothetical protein
MTPEEILKGLIDGKYKPDQPFEFDDMEKNGSRQEVQFSVLNTDNWFNANIDWSCSSSRGMKGDYLTPDDRDEYVLDDIDIIDLKFGDGEDEIEIDNPKIKKLFAKYLSTLWDSEHYDVRVDNKFLKETNIKNYKNFLLEWGYGGEGGVASKDPVRVSLKMIDDIKIEDDTDNEDMFTYLDDTLDVDLNESDDWADPDIYGIPLYLSEDQEKVYSDGTPLYKSWTGRNLVLIEKKGKYYSLGEIRYGSPGWFMFYEDSNSIEHRRFKEFNGEIKRELNDAEKEKVYKFLSQGTYLPRNLMEDSVPYIKIINDFINEGFAKNFFKKKNKFVEGPHSDVDPLGEEDWNEDNLDNFIYQKLVLKKIQTNDQYDAHTRVFVIYLKLGDFNSPFRPDGFSGISNYMAIGKEQTWSVMSAEYGREERTQIIPYTTLVRQIIEQRGPIKNQGDSYKTDYPLYIGKIPHDELKDCGRVVDENIRRKLYEFLQDNDPKNVFMQKVSERMNTNENKRFDRNDEDWRDLEQEDEIDDTITNDYIQWKKEGKPLYDFLKQLDDRIINNLLEYYGHEQEMENIVDRLNQMEEYINEENLCAIEEDIENEIVYENEDDNRDYDDEDEEGVEYHCKSCDSEQYFEYVDGDYECTECGYLLNDDEIANI